MGRDEALALLKEMQQLVVAKGKSLTRVDLKSNRPNDDTLASLLLGPTGNLRAPTMKVGKTVVVGFNADAYEELFGE
jgi:arsenate reductase-like glutaredoxin family protein